MSKNEDTNKLKKIECRGGTLKILKDDWSSDSPENIVNIFNSNNDINTAERQNRFSNSDDNFDVYSCEDLIYALKQDSKDISLKNNLFFQYHNLFAYSKKFHFEIPVELKNYITNDINKDDDGNPTIKIFNNNNFIYGLSIDNNTLPNINSLLFNYLRNNSTSNDDYTIIDE